MPRHFLMCRPDHFTVEYAINPWMHPEAGSIATSPSASGKVSRPCTRASGTR